MLDQQGKLKRKHSVEILISGDTEEDLAFQLVCLMEIIETNASDDKSEIYWDKLHDVIVGLTGHLRVEYTHDPNMTPEKFAQEVKKIYATPNNLS